MFDNSLSSLLESTPKGSSFDVKTLTKDVFQSNRIFEGHTASITSMKFFSPPGMQKHVISTSADKTARLWNLGGFTIQFFKGHTDSVTTCSVRDSHLLTGSRDCTVRCWDIDAGQTTATFAHPKKVTGVHFSHNALFTNCGDYKIRLWDTRSEKCVSTFSASTDVVTSFRVLDNRPFLLTTSVDKSIHMFDIRNPKGPPVSFTGHTDWIWSCQLTPDQNSLFTCSRDRKIKQWDISRFHYPVENPISTFIGHSEDVYKLEYKHGLLFSASWDNTIGVWSPNFGKPIHLFKGHPRRILSMAVDPKPDSHIVIAGDASHSILMWDYITGECSGALTGHQNDVISILMDEEENLLTADRNGKIFLWDYPAIKKCIPTSKLRANVDKKYAQKEHSIRVPENFSFHTPFDPLIKVSKETQSLTTVLLATLAAYQNHSMSHSDIFQQFSDLLTKFAKNSTLSSSDNEPVPDSVEDIPNVSTPDDEFATACKTLKLFSSQLGVVYSQFSKLLKAGVSRPIEHFLKTDVSEGLKNIEILENLFTEYSKHKAHYDTHCSDWIAGESNHLALNSGKLVLAEVDFETWKNKFFEQSKITEKSLYSMHLIKRLFILERILIFFELEYNKHGQILDILSKNIQYVRCLQGYLSNKYKETHVDFEKLIEQEQIGKSSTTHKGTVEVTSAFSKAIGTILQSEHTPDISEDPAPAASTSTN